MLDSFGVWESRGRLFKEVDSSVSSAFVMRTNFARSNCNLFLVLMCALVILAF